MKKTLLLLVTMFLSLHSAWAGDKILQITTAIDGKSWPENGQITFAWESALPLYVSCYADKYSDDGTVIDAINIVNYGFALVGPNSTSLNPVSEKLDPGRYRLRVVGTSTEGERFVDTSGLFDITPAASMSVTPLGLYPQWFPGEKRKFIFRWTNLMPDSHYSLYLFPRHYRGEADGFLLATGMVTTHTGGTVIHAPFPTKDLSAFPTYHTSIPHDGIYDVMIIDEHSYLRTVTSVDLVISDARITSLGHGTITAGAHETVVPLTLTVDARFTDKDSRNISIPLTYQPTLKNRVRVKTAIYEKGRRISPWKVTHVNSRATEQSIRLAGFRLRSGEVRELEVRTKILSGHGVLVNLKDGDSAKGDVTLAYVPGEWATVLIAP